MPVWADWTGEDLRQYEESKHNLSKILNDTGKSEYTLRERIGAQYEVVSNVAAHAKPTVSFIGTAAYTGTLSIWASVIENELKKKGIT
jgi:hypothetical protein